MSDYGFIETLARRAGSAGLSGRLAAWIVLGGPAAARKAHRDAWSPELADGGNGRSIFQKRAEETLLKQFGPHGLRRGEHTSDAIQLAAGSVIVAILHDGVRVHAPGERLDIHRWDVRTPSELRDCVVEMLRRLFHPTSAT